MTNDFWDISHNRPLKALLLFLAIVLGSFLLWHILTSWMPFLSVLALILVAPWFMGELVFFFLDEIINGEEDRATTKTELKIYLGVALGIFLFSYGIPTVFNGLAFGTLTYSEFWRGYYAFLDWLLSFVNGVMFLNLKASPESLRMLNTQTAQNTGWATFVILAPCTYWQCYRRKKEAERIREEKRLQKQREEDTEMERWRAEENRKMEIEEKKRREREAREQKIIEKKEEQAKSPNPWDSGFL